MLAAGVPGWPAAGGATTGGDAGAGSGIATIPRFSLGEQYTWGPFGMCVIFPI
jgi:hypothetical protein